MKMFVDVPAVYLYRDVVDFRKSINGLAGLIESELDVSVLSGAVFVFCNKHRDKLKVLYWDKSGFALWYKRLDRDKFKWPKKLETEALSLSEAQLHGLLSGYDIVGHKPIELANKSVI